MAEIDPLEWRKLSKSELKKLWGKETRPDQTERVIKLRENFIQLLDKKIDVLLETMPIRPTLLQEIPPLAKTILESIDFPNPDEEYTTSKGSLRTYAHAKSSDQIVQMALTLAKKLGLMRKGMDLPLRRVWYAFIKATLERGLAGYVYGKGDVIGDSREPEDGDYTSAFSDIIKNTNLWYSDFGVRNPSATSTIIEPKFFPPILIGLEKRSYYDVLQQMSELLGFSIYSAGGQSKFSEQEVLAKEIKEKIFDQHPEFKDLDIYIISDFDPAGIDIAINIAEHQKFYQERFGKMIHTERLAPMPEHYTREELEQGLYTVKEPTRKTWNYPEIIAQRTFTDDEGEWEIERERGLEVESLPDQPLEKILKQPPTDWDERDYRYTDGDWKSLTRMRFILFDKLIDKYGLSMAFKVLLDRASPYASSLADEYIDKSNFKGTKRRMSKSRELINEFISKPNKWINNYIKEQKGDLEDKIQEWINDIIEQYTDETHEDFRENEREELIKEIKNNLYYAISRNQNSFSIEFPTEFDITEIDEEEDFKIEIPEEFIENLKPILNYTLCIAANVNEAKKYIEELEEPTLKTTKDEWGYDIKVADGEEMLSQTFEMPPIRQCEYVEVEISQYYPYNMEIKEVKWKEIEEGIDCDEYIEKIKNLEFQLGQLKAIRSSLEEDIEKLKEQETKETPEELKYSFQVVNELKKQIYIKDELIKRLKKSLTNVQELQINLKECEQERDILKEFPRIEIEEAERELKETERKLMEAKEGLEHCENLLEKKSKQISQLKEIRDIRVEAQKEELFELRERIRAPRPERKIDPFFHIEWNSVQSQNVDIIGAQIKIMKEEVKDDEKVLLRVINSKIKKVEELVNKLKNPNIDDAVKSDIYFDMNKTVTTIKNMHLNL